MKILFLAGLLALAYVYTLTHTTDVVTGQLQRVNASYQHVAQQADTIAAGRQ